MKTTYYHGTSADNLQSILKYGLSCSENKLWNCSEDAIYLWEPKGCGEANCLDEDQYEQEAFRMANESGQIACAIAKDCRVIVLKIELDDEQVCDDCSCENMQYTGAKCIYRDIKPSEIVDISISNDLSLLKGYFIGLIADRDYNNCEFTQLELKVAECFRSAELIDYIDELIEFETLQTA